MYDRALKSSGYTVLKSIIYSAPKQETERETRKKRTCKRNVIWFNPPFSRSVKTNIGGTFLNLIAKNFPRGHRLYKIFNKNTVKISYSCLKNMKTIIQSHNSAISKQSSNNTPTNLCNCRVKANCPLRGECLATAVVYKAQVTSGAEIKSYIGISGGPFKQRFNNHTKSFKHENYEKETELSKYVWDLKRRGISFGIEWEIVNKSNTSQRKSGQCNLCMEEKLAILHTKDTLNKKTELVSKCRHGNRPPSRVKKK